ncbi:phosphoglycerate dehydrogenase [Demequina capsici]|uniref:Phosphoglycerate dehydrogenase n=1 Tax=Demequina capsici TaxID=3075620 RepID=A0AA96JCF6_9MICO|nr:phosphoglycerate dehydrogenase [Demequina sp. OYTSA14]WNM23594.1 phosphoglycerate dehydrogenase [Demequina sp. OYTSA14]
MLTLVSLIGPQESLHRELNGAAADYAMRLGMNYEWRPLDQWSPTAALEALRDADVAIIGTEQYDAALINQLPSRTRLLVRFGVGFDGVDIEAATARDIAVARTIGANARGVAEMALTLVLALRRKIVPQHLAGATPWSPLVGDELTGTVGIIGLGAVGRALASLLQGFGVRVIAHDPFTDTADGVDTVYRDLDDMLAEADVVSLHLPYLAETHHLFDADRFERMKPGAVLLNTARGALVDEAALVDALTSGHLGGAGLDVFETEPLPESSPLRTMPNVVLTPHSASQTREALTSIYMMSVDIANDFAAGQASPALLNPEVMPIQA